MRRQARSWFSVVMATAMGCAFFLASVVTLPACGGPEVTSPPPPDPVPPMRERAKVEDKDLERTMKKDEDDP